MTFLFAPAPHDVITTFILYSGNHFDMYIWLQTNSRMTANQCFSIMCERQWFYTCVLCVRGSESIHVYHVWEAVSLYMCIMCERQWVYTCVLWVRSSESIHVYYGWEAVSLYMCIMGERQWVYTCVLWVRSSESIHVYYGWEAVSLYMCIMGSAFIHVCYGPRLQLLRLAYQLD